MIYHKYKVINSGWGLVRHICFAVGRTKVNMAITKLKISALTKGSIAFTAINI